MILSDIPKFQVGDEVVSHRGEPARITKVIQVPEPGKSHRVEVEWADQLKNPDKIAYYEEVFSHADR